MDVVNAGSAIYAEQFKGPAVAATNTDDNGTARSGVISEFSDDKLTLSEQAKAMLSAEQSTPETDDKLNNGGGTRPPGSDYKSSADAFNGGGTRPPEGTIEVDQSNN